MHNHSGLLIEWKMLERCLFLLACAFYVAGVDLVVHLFELLYIRKHVIVSISVC